jgi:hypothetical protein
VVNTAAPTAESLGWGVDKIGVVEGKGVASEGSSKEEEEEEEEEEVEENAAGRGRCLGGSLVRGFKVTPGVSIFIIEVRKSPGGEGLSGTGVVFEVLPPRLSGRGTD